MQKALPIWKYIKKYAGVVLFPIALYALLMILMPGKITLRIIPYIFTQSVMPAVIAWGASFSMVIKNYNFSTGVCVITAAIIGGNIGLNLNMGMAGLVLLCAVIGTVCGCLVGGLFVLLKIPSLIVSIGSLLVLESVCSIVFGGNGIYLPMKYIVFGHSINTILFGIGAFILAYTLYNFLPFGFHVRAIGSNQAIAQASGLKLYQTRFLCFMVSGLFAGLYAALMLGTTGVQRPVAAMGSMKFVFDAMMCVLIGMSLGKSVNLIVSIFIGSIIMQIVQLALVSFNFPSTFSQSIVALIVLVAMVYSSRREIAEKVARHNEELKAATEK